MLIPVYNEEAGLEQRLQRVAAVPVDKESSWWTIAPAMDGAILGAATIPGLRVVSHSVNRGKGAASVRRWLPPPATPSSFRMPTWNMTPRLSALLAPIWEAAPRWSMACVTWPSAAALSPGQSLSDDVDQPHLCARLADMETCYKVMTIAIARSLEIECNRFDLEPEITAKILRQGYVIHQVPISYEPRTAKKLSPWRDGLPALRALWRYRTWQPRMAPSSDAASRPNA